MDRTDRDDDVPDQIGPNAREQSPPDNDTRAENERDEITARVARFKAMQQRLTRAREDDAKAIWDNRFDTRRYRGA